MKPPGPLPSIVYQRAQPAGARVRLAEGAAAPQLMPERQAAQGAEDGSTDLTVRTSGQL
jgi:hypothetical protein